MNPTQLVLISLTLLICITLAENLICPPGCTTNCNANYTCLGTCGDAYDKDNSCNYCKFTDQFENDFPVYLLKDDLSCVKFTKKAFLDPRSTWLPAEEYLEEINLNESKNYTIEESGYVDFSICCYPQKFRQGRWFKFNLSQMTKDHLAITIKKLDSTENVVDFSVDGTNSQYYNINPHCYVHFNLNKTIYETTGKFPIQLEVEENSTGQHYYYFFASISGFTNKLTFSIELKEEQGLKVLPAFDLTQEVLKDLSEDLTKKLPVVIPFEQFGYFARPACIPNKYMKALLFTVQYEGKGYVFIDTRSSNRVIYLSEVNMESDENNNLVSTGCVKVSTGQKLLSIENREEDNEVGQANGVHVKLDSDGKKKYLSFLSEDYRASIIMTVSIICPNNCNLENGFGKCDSDAGKCVCNSGYGGEDCHLMCYYNGRWQVNEEANLCYFGSKDCDQYCQCTQGKSVQNHVCVTSECRNGKLGSGDECKQKSEGCQTGCTCDTSLNYTSKSGVCVSDKCGNGMIDNYYDSNGKFIRKEECDGGVNCNITCQCIEGHVQSSSDPLSCMQKTLSAGEITGIVIGGVVAFVIILCFLLIVFIFVFRYKKIDINIYKTQQPIYHFYITGATRALSGKQSRYYITPTRLDFGNDTKLTAIGDTRFEKMEIKNCSKNKWMMVIFHTPNNPKYTFYFDPQVLYLRPRLSSMHTMTCFMTIHCTTRIRDLRIPYSVWFASSRSILESVASLLKNKSFENWTEDDRKKMESLCKNIKRRHYENLVITTDAMNTVHLDMDELNMSENPIAEGAMGKVYIGNYRSVPVAIKQFRWESLSDEEMKELKREVESECDIMSKLRNPFIANYMGAVTYIPQVSMVIQFFVLGSLGEYLRQDKQDYLKLPYKLKVRMLFDTAKGMQFLHENRIMHLDLKPDNLLVNSLDPHSVCSVKITDFGTSRFVKKTMKKNEDKGLGTPVYAAPETFHDEYTYSGDVYSYGITAWEIFYQAEPYKEFKSIFEIKDHVINGKRLRLDESMPSDYAQLIQSCWKQDGKERPTFDQVTKLVVKVDDEVAAHSGLDDGVSQEKIDDFAMKRTEKMQKQINELYRD
ncbi:serine-threonine protein kinase, putative [Entamoeba invadens IP1]|uniref:serine-threonine protein kinase, putative n=1 Tax=Entamoeba invadens IP1 TaxID=370355 RepID=UPI0002C3D229|nr:serine-threonine protein kinase, putative [Entamoeba invadens IP1]ELP90619.1 serine-threonine protein kinase, putative [Entamoeba invadens IP1]|eukprot:XP_004257390.1 serine-threonine protein kinase, putative [Entamoeba invadens IP1]